MTTVTLSCGKNGLLKKCEANGHACFSKKGTDIVCSAVTALLRTTMEVLSHQKDVFLIADTSTRGSLTFSVEVKDNSVLTEACLKYAADFLRDGCRWIAEAYPANLTYNEILAEA